MAQIAFVTLALMLTGSGFASAQIEVDRDCPGGICADASGERVVLQLAVSSYESCQEKLRAADRLNPVVAPWRPARPSEPEAPGEEIAAVNAFCRALFPAVGRVNGISFLMPRPEHVKFAVVIAEDDCKEKTAAADAIPLFLSPWKEIGAAEYCGQLAENEMLPPAADAEAAPAYAKLAPSSAATSGASTLPAGLVRAFCEKNPYPFCANYKKPTVAKNPDSSTKPGPANPVPPPAPAPSTPAPAPPPALPTPPSGPVASGDKYGWDLLKKDLQGWASETTGGFGGTLYEVSRFDDYGKKDRPINGTLRYAIEELSGPTWIRFPNRAKQTIMLKQPIRLRKNITIDGRRAAITISHKINWSDFKKKETPGFRAQCERARPDVVQPGLFGIKNAQNVIITHLNLDRLGYYDSPWEKSDPNMDKECLGGMISIGNQIRSPNSAAIAPSHNIWVNHVTFQHCGDGCLDAVRPEPRGDQFITISNNHFKQTDKSMLLGSFNDSTNQPIPFGSYLTKYSIYGNHFDAVVQRNPYTRNSIAHIYNNFYSKWTSYGVGYYQAKVFFENNLIDPGKRDLLMKESQKPQGSVVFSKNIEVSGKPSQTDYERYAESRKEWVTAPFAVTPARQLSPASFQGAGYLGD